MIVILLIIFLVVVTASIILFQFPPFGAAASGTRLARMKRSPHYKKGQFHNLQPTPALTEGYSNFSVFYEYLLGAKHPSLFPTEEIPHIKTAITSIPLTEDVYIWLGHSSYYIQLDGVRFLIDPVFSRYGSPFPFFNKAFAGTAIYQASDFPVIDYLILTHDHYDHLDYATVRALKDQVQRVILPLGVGAHLERWGYTSAQLIEEDWNTTISLQASISITFTPARHFSGRKFKRNNTLWTSYVLKTSSHTIFIGGDSGYGEHFNRIGQIYGPFDYAILENGQYNEAWRYIHAMPHEVIQAASDLNAKNILPVHYGKFALAKHAWNEPLDEIIRYGQGKNQSILTPTLGEIVYLKDSPQIFKEWWKV